MPEQERWAFAHHIDAKSLSMVIRDRPDLALIV